MKLGRCVLPIIPVNNKLSEILVELLLLRRQEQTYFGPDELSGVFDHGGCSATPRGCYKGAAAPGPAVLGPAVSASGKFLCALYLSLIHISEPTRPY